MGYKIFLMQMLLAGLKLFELNTFLTDCSVIMILLKLNNNSQSNDIMTSSVVSLSCRLGSGRMQALISLQI